MSNWVPDFSDSDDTVPFGKPPEPYGTTPPDTDGEVKFGKHQTWNVFCQCKDCVIPRLAFQRWRYKQGLLTEDPKAPKRTKISPKKGR